MSGSKSSDDIDYSKDPPEIELPNIYPVEWTVETPKLGELYERAKKEAWNPSSIDWASVDPKDYDDKQKTAMVYWWALLANLELWASRVCKGYDSHFRDTRAGSSEENVCINRDGRVQARRVLHAGVQQTVPEFPPGMEAQVFI